MHFIPALNAQRSLQGLAVGERFFVHPNTVERLIAERALPAAPWPYTDDTQMALSIMEILGRHGRIDQDELAAHFAAHYDPSRGYGPAMHQALARIGHGEPWQRVAESLFAGQGSFGNGAAMRVAPIGAYYADDLCRAVEDAAGSAVVTHAHPEAGAGAIAVAVAAAWAGRLRAENVLPRPAGFLDLVLPHVPPGEVQSRLRRGRDLSENAPVQTAVGVLGNGITLGACRSQKIPVAGDEGDRLTQDTAGPLCTG